mmetsp:Transcript_39935/g.40455  ORF Transcript_39935/g.40455 Transcript_39935/m.40455 type:complete len:280 (-) Transcript_39935:157-996(-)
MSDNSNNADDVDNNRNNNIEDKASIAIELLPSYRKELGEGCDGVDDEQLLKFLYWNPNIERATGRYRAFIHWKTTNPGMFDNSLRVSKDTELERCLLSEVFVSPPTLLTKQGGPIIIGRLRNNDLTDGRTAEGVCRMIFYTIDSVISRPETQRHGVTIIHDLRGFDRKNNSSFDISKKLVQGLFGQFPVHVNAIYICHAPLIAKGFFKFVSNILMTKKIRERVKFIDEFSELSEVIDEEDLLIELGGTLEWSIKDWIEQQKIKEEDGSRKSLTDIDPKK